MYGENELIFKEVILFWNDLDLNFYSFVITEPFHELGFVSLNKGRENLSS